MQGNICIHIKTHSNMTILGNRRVYVGPPPSTSISSPISQYFLKQSAGDFAGSGARKSFTSCFTSNLQFSYQTWNASHRNYSWTFTTSYHVSHYPVYPEITKITSSIDAKTEPQKGQGCAWRMPQIECSPFISPPTSPAGRKSEVPGRKRVFTARN